MPNANDHSANDKPNTITGAVARKVTPWPDLQEQDDWIIEELPVALSYNGISHVVMMASPILLKEFALGFSFSEGIINSAADIYDCEIQQSESGISINLEISQRCFSALKNRQRQLSGKTGCGICGLESLQMLARQFQPIASPQQFQHRSLQKAIKTLRQKQQLQDLTGAVHAAAWCDPQGNILHIAEDVGRHNALDKLIGILLQQQTDTRLGFITLSSRVSFEMAQKTIAIGAPLLVGASAPTSMALSEADKYGLCVVGFARPGRQVVYSQLGRVVEG
ncbi:formate dehydrogenase accessory sulfurtransferase FdhD [Dasania sp. GY-MA-18]|uniref:Sulfur carrier protein FdhD n=1 Tax=Dasania phycosphaerae TaxID=2950436 RepID=A0A9J6RLY6_9GAMM|nr:MULTISPECIES: formate dehydrogenase accessory sulfurtransferase FdhD [Dasania]MCR8922778.1 formate dehydrogenase accessory sulfurtransferase FdhD [Dasania sp. GY-MA-18]MCZ0865208.1 formate dehydrogenase accessory sulfurtransferase FdhD [Dasania phycosphaerae]MCZ0868934.1 formate dehydrogenase accessory sulfurtransferase FdhD [Dasania phycosphaerae]